jgi:two-component system copper resistance phosphate regulon response regulator CusR
MKVLIVEDDPALAGAVREGLEEEGIRVDVASSFRDGSLKAAPGAHDVIVLDVMLPGGSGVQLCQRLRAEGNDTPVLFLTALGTENDRVDGFDAGGDDYLTKPFSFRELVARLRALARRPPDLLRNVRTIADLEVDLDAHTASRRGAALALTAQEWALLEFFVRHQDKVVSRAEITAYVWDDNHDPFTNLLEVLVWRLRKKVDEGHTPALIHTVRGAGYRFGA